MEFLKNRTTQIALGVILLVLVGLGGYYVIAGKSNSNTKVDQSADKAVQTLKPEDIGLTMEVTSDKKKVLFKISKAKDISSIEYELTYEADSTAQEQSEGGEARVQRGITGESKIESGESSFTSDELDLGSCSKNVCRYDTGVKSVDMTLKVTKSDGNVYVVQDKLEIESSDE